jgi:hypothetical protein
MQPEDAARHEQDRRERKAALVARRGDVKAAKQREETERAERRQAEAARLEAEQLATAATAARAFEIYREVRARAAHMRDTGGTGVERSPVEAQLLAQLAPLWDADPGTIGSLRRACAPISGVRAEEYAPPSPDLMLRLKQGYRVLQQQVGDALFVEESPLLGGFGYRRDGHLFNEDTLMFFNALVALDDAAVLPAFRDARSGRRRLVWESGGGWGGFAYQFTRVCPNVTYVITAPPELFLVSAVYLATALPEARCRFVDAAAPGTAWDQWEDADFVFVPDTDLARFAPPRLDLTVDLGAWLLMTAGRVRGHARRAFELGSRYLFSVLPAHTAADVSRVWGCVEPWYWLHPVPPRAETMPAVPQRGAADVPPEIRHAHLAGWRRLVA